MSSLERAIAIAARAHEGQVDKAGMPYILHPLRVMLAVRTPEERIVAVLHDVLEDTAVSIEDLRAEGFPDPVLAALVSVTKREGEEYPEFVQRAIADPIGRRVKLAELLDNSDLSRIPGPTPRDLERMERYRRAIAAIRAADGEPIGQQGSN